MLSRTTHRDRAVRMLVSGGLVVIAVLGGFSMTFVYLLYAVATVLAVTAVTGHWPLHRRRP